MNQFQGYDPSVQLGYSLGSSLGQGLQALAQHKMDTMQKQKIQQLLMKNNFDAPTSELLAEIYHTSPDNFTKLFQGMSGGSQQSQDGTQQPISLQQALSNRGKST